MCLQYSPRVDVPQQPPHGQKVAVYVNALRRLRRVDVLQQHRYGQNAEQPGCSLVCYR